MINEIKLFIFVLSIVFLLKVIFSMIFEITRENPDELKLKEVEKIFVYISISYIITYILI